MENQEKACIGCSSCLAVLVLFFILLGSAISSIDPYETGLDYNQPQGILKPDLLGTGVQLTSVFGTNILWPLKFTDIQHEKLDCNSYDGLPVVMDASFQHLPVRSSIYDLTLKFKDFETFNAIVETKAISIIADVCGNYTAEEFQTKRALLADDMALKVKTVLRTDFHTDVTGFQLRNILRPNPYEEVVSEKENARNDIDLANNERAKALILANTTLKEATQAATKLLDAADIDVEVIMLQVINQAEAYRLKFIADAEAWSIIANQYKLNATALLQYYQSNIFSTGNVSIALKSPAEMNFQDQP